MILSVLGGMPGMPLHVEKASCRVVYSKMHFQLNGNLLLSSNLKIVDVACFYPCYLAGTKIF